MYADVFIIKLIHLQNLMVARETNNVTKKPMNGVTVNSCNTKWLKKIKRHKLKNEYLSTQWLTGHILNANSYHVLNETQIIFHLQASIEKA